MKIRVGIGSWYIREHFALAEPLAGRSSSPPHPRPTKTETTRENARAPPNTQLQIPAINDC